DFHVTGVQTCALPIFLPPAQGGPALRAEADLRTAPFVGEDFDVLKAQLADPRARRLGHRLLGRKPAGEKFQDPSFRPRQIGPLPFGQNASRQPLRPEPANPLQFHQIDADAENHRASTPLIPHPTETSWPPPGRRRRARPTRPPSASTNPPSRRPRS